MFRKSKGKAMAKPIFKRVMPTCFNCDFGSVKPEDPPCDICENASEWMPG